MKISRSTLIGILLIGGALALHFAKKADSEETDPSSFQKIYHQDDLYAHRVENSEGSAEKVYQRAEILVVSSRDEPAAERRKSLLDAFALLQILKNSHPRWNPELVEKRILQTKIAIFDLQGNLWEFFEGFKPTNESNQERGLSNPPPDSTESSR